MFRDRRVWFVIPAVLIPPFWTTGLFLYQVSVAGDLGWSPGLIATAFAAFALARIAVGLVSGPLIDRFSARTLFPILLIPMTIGLAAATVFSGSWAAFVYMGLIGATMGLAGTLKSALWAELYGKEMIGTVQSLFASVMVFSTALSPFLVGWMLDNDVSIHAILIAAMSTAVAAGLLSVRILPAFDTD